MISPVDKMVWLACCSSGISLDVLHDHDELAVRLEGGV